MNSLMIVGILSVGVGVLYRLVCRALSNYDAAMPDMDETW
jgi:hypothetical protein